MIIRNKERRLARRIPVRLEAYILTGLRTYTGFIENISEDGFEYSADYSSKKDLQHAGRIEIIFQVPSGEALNLTCKVKWLLNASPEEESFLMGMKIINSTPKFRDLLKTLDIISIN